MEIIRTILLIPLVLLATCNQDPIFTMISSEVEPKDPLIKGSPSKIVKYDSNIYVANGRLWSCGATADGRWAPVGGVPSKIYDIAAGNDGLYMLRVNDSDTSVHRLGGGEIANPAGGMIQGLYSDGGENPGAVYAGSMFGDDSYAILEMSGGAFTKIFNISGPLNGAAKSSNATYFATARDGILRRDGGSTTFTPVGGSTAYYSIAGIINAEGRIIAVNGYGTILEVDTTNNTVTPYSTGTDFTGALTVYYGNTANSGRTLLLLGVKNSTYDMGYREIYIPPNPDDPITFLLNIPGELASFSTVSGRDRYEATLAKYAVNSLMQLSKDPGGTDGLPALFASTQKDGLFSYRNNEWNAEE